MSLNGISEKNFINGDESVNKNKNYRVRESKWFCEPCGQFIKKLFKTKNKAFKF